MDAIDAREQLKKLLRLQEIVLEAREATRLVDERPTRIEEIECRFRERNAEYVAVKERFDALEADHASRSTELKTLEESRTKYQEDLKRVSNEREYSAMLREIDAVKAHIAEHEEAILKDMEEIETVQVDLQKHEEHIQEERKKVEAEREEVESSASEAGSRIVSLTTERDAIETELPRSLVAAVRRIEASRQGKFLARAEDGCCQSCFVRVRPQAFQEIKLATKIHVCSNCRRILFHPGAFAEAKPQAAAESADIVNGGTV